MSALEGQAGVVSTQEARWPRGSRSGGGRRSLLRCPPAALRLSSGSFTATSGKKQAAKSKEELAQEKKKELERRLQDVSGQLGNSKKPARKGTCLWAGLLPAWAVPGHPQWSSVQSGEGRGGPWAADPGLSLWLCHLMSRVSSEEASELLRPQFAYL